MGKIQLRAWGFMKSIKRYGVHRLIILLLSLSSLCMCMYACVLCVLVPEEVEKGCEIPLELESQVAVSHLMWVVGLNSVLTGHWSS